MTDVQSAAHIAIKYIDYDQLVADDDNVRTELTEIDALAESIWSAGLINPITVRLNGNGDLKFHIVAGFRRHAALGKLIKQKRWNGQVPVVVRTDEDDDSRVVAMIVENLQRVDVNPVDEAFGIQRLVEEYSYSIADVALNLAVSEQIVKDRLKLCTLTEGALELVRKRVISIESGLALAGADDVVQDKVVKTIGTAGNSYNTRPEVIKDEIRKAKFEQLKKELVKELKRLTGLPVKTSYPYNKTQLASLSNATVAKLSAWWGQHEGKGGTEINLSSNYDTWTAYVIGPKSERAPSTPSAPVPCEPPTVEDMIGSVEVPETVTKWVTECRDVAVSIEAAKADRERITREARAKFVHDLGKAEIAAAAMSSLAGGAVYSIERMINSGSIEDREYIRAAMGWTDKDITPPTPAADNPVLPSFDGRMVHALIFSAPKYIARAAALAMVPRHGGGELHAKFHEHLTASGAIEVPAWPEQPEEIKAYIAEAGDDEWQVESFDDVEDTVEGYLLSLEIKAGAADHDE